MRSLVLASLLLTLPAPVLASEVKQIMPQTRVQARKSMIYKDGKTVLMWEESAHSENIQRVIQTPVGPMKTPGQTAVNFIFVVDALTGKVTKKLNYHREDLNKSGILLPICDDSRNCAPTSDGKRWFGYFLFDKHRFLPANKPSMNAADAARQFQQELNANLAQESYLLAEVNPMTGAVRRFGGMDPFGDGKPHVVASGASGDKVVLSANDKWMAIPFRTHFADGTGEIQGIRVWDTQSGKLLANLPFGYARFAGDKLWVMHTSPDKSGTDGLVAYQAPAFKPVDRWQEPGLASNDLVFSVSPSQKMALVEVSGPAAANPVFVDLATKQVRPVANASAITFQYDSDFIVQTNWSPDNRYVSLHGRYNKMWVVDVQKAEVVTEFDLQLRADPANPGFHNAKWVSPRELLVIGETPGSNMPSIIRIKDPHIPG